ncbi:MAG TPA: penicillin acylase family protein, partial [Acetobacteraceae bacterium]|nr:penicillin acylase family protein [Acetobacteraceae bacterium]
MRRVFRLLRRLLVVLVVVLLLAAGGIGALLWDTLPDANQTLRLPGLSAPVTVRLDRHGIPFIHAASMLDAATALGYLHARDRMFQMELMRRAA